MAQTYHERNLLGKQTQRKNRGLITCLVDFPLTPTQQEAKHMFLPQQHTLSHQEDLRAARSNASKANEDPGATGEASVFASIGETKCLGLPLGMGFFRKFFLGLRCSKKSKQCLDRLYA